MNRFQSDLLYGCKRKNICPLSLVVINEVIRCSMCHPDIICDLDKRNRWQAFNMFIKADS